MRKICIVDYGVGNLKSVSKAFQKVGAEVIVAQLRSEIKKYDVIVLPGVGSFDAAMENLEKRNLVDILLEKAKNCFFFGVCLGYQLLYESSEEGIKKGLAILPGKVVRFQKEFGLKVPHVGWNRIVVTRESKLLDNLPGKYVYFVHSYYVVNSNKSAVCAICNYGVDFDAAIEIDNLFGTQFHPEKSGAVGLKILENFVKVVSK